MIIVDTGFLYAIANRADKYHKNAVELISQLTEGLVTTWPVVTETSHLLLQRMGTIAHAKFIDNIFEGSIKIQNLPDESIEQIPKLIKKYADLPMDLADASLVLLADLIGSGRIASTDLRDFRTYRWKNHKPFQNVLITD